MSLPSYFIYTSKEHNCLQTNLNPTVIPRVIKNKSSVQCSSRTIANQRPRLKQNI